MHEKWNGDLQDESRVRRDETGEAAVGQDTIWSVNVTILRVGDTCSTKWEPCIGRNVRVHGAYRSP